MESLSLRRPRANLSAMYEAAKTWKERTDRCRHSSKDASWLCDARRAQLPAGGWPTAPPGGPVQGLRGRAWPFGVW